MKKVFISEWKLLYPIKKITVFIGEIGFIAAAFGAILMFIRRDFNFHGFGGRIYECILGVGMIVAPIACFKPTIRYLKPFYRCLPVLSKRKTRREIVDIIEQEQFSRIENLKENEYLYPRILISERFLRIRNHYIPRHGIVTMWIMRTDVSRGGVCHDLWVTLITGESFCINIATVAYQAKKEKEWSSDAATFCLLIQVLEAYTDGMGFMVPRDSEKEFRKYAVDIKKWAAPYIDHIDKHALVKLFTEENSLQEKLVDNLLDQQKKLPPEKRFLLYAHWFLFNVSARKYIKKSGWSS